MFTLCHRLSHRLTLRSMSLQLAARLFVGSLAFLPSSAAVAAQNSEELLVNDPRPLAEAIQQFEQRCHCVVTYEDIKWQQDQVEDISASVRRAPNAPRAQVPKGGSFLFILSRQLASATPAQIGSSLRELLAAYETSNHFGNFRLVEGNRAFHVLPSPRAVLDSRVTVAQGDQSLAQAIKAILESVTKSTGEAVVLATGPLNLLKIIVPIQAQNERAGDVLIRVLFATGRELSWQLLYDFGMKRYYLNIHPV